MKSVAIVMALVVSLVYSMAPMALAQSTKDSSQIDMLLAVNRAGNSAQAPHSKTSARHWSTRKKVIVAGVAACLIATAIAVPISVHVHHEHEQRQRARRALSNFLLQENQVYSASGQLSSQIAADLQREKTIQNLLSSGHLSAVQTAGLRGQLTALQNSVSQLRTEMNTDLLSGLMETAGYAATVPPSVIAANRTQLANLASTNFLGQNTPAIAAQEAQYAEMWAQDAAAMAGYGW